MKNIAWICVLILLAGCSGLNAQRREASSAAKLASEAEASVSAARQAGAAKCAAKELKNAEADLQLAKNNMGKKDYAMASAFAKSAESNSAQALKKCEDAKKAKKR